MDSRWHGACGEAEWSPNLQVSSNTSREKFIWENSPEGLGYVRASVRIFFIIYSTANAL